MSGLDNLFLNETPLRKRTYKQGSLTNQANLKYVGQERETLDTYPFNSRVAPLCTETRLHINNAIYTYVVSSITINNANITDKL